MGNNLSNKNIGIIGYGKIGKKLNKYLKLFNCNIFIFEKKKILKVKKYSLKEIFKKCDLVCLSLSLNKSTKEIIDKNVLKNANKKIIIINASRGAIINEKHLLGFLKKNSHASAFLDCFTKEPYKGILLRQKNVFPTPHIASFTQETRLKMEYSASKNLIQYLEKKLIKIKKIPISLVIPTLGKSHIISCLHKINSSSHLLRELLIVVPKDNYNKIKSKSLIFKDLNIRVIESYRKNQVYQRILGFKKAKYDYIMQLDDDVKLNYRCLFKLYEFIKGKKKKIAVAPRYSNKLPLSKIYKQPKKVFY